MTAPAPGTPEWARVVTASKVPAILGVSPYAAPRSLWLKMRGDIPWDDGANGAAKSRGKYLENGILDWWIDQHAEDIHPAERPIRQYYATRPDLPWAAATPDLWVTLRGIGKVVVDAKTSRDDSEWGCQETDDLPLHYVAQLQWQMHLTGARVAYVALLTQFLDLREYVIEYDEVNVPLYERACAAFVASLADPDAIPDMDATVATWKAEKRRHPEIDADSSVEIDEDLARRFVAVKAKEAEIREAQSRMRDAMGEARLATFDGVVIARRQPNRSGVSLVAVAKTIPTRCTESEASESYAAGYRAGLTKATDLIQMEMNR